MKQLLLLILLSGFLFVSCTQNEKVIPEPAIYLSMPDNGFDVDKDSSFIIEPKITYDILSTYSWTLNDEVINTKKDYTFRNFGFGSYELHFSVQTPSGSDAIVIPVHSLDILTFEEYNQLNKDGYSNNPDNGIFQFDYSILTNDNTNGTTDDWSGFALSKNTNKTTASADNQFSVYSKSGAESSKNFAVFKQSELIDHQIKFNDGNGHIIKSIEVNNSTYTYLIMQSGGIFDKKNNKDFYCLTIIGFDAIGNPTGSVDFYLADYRFETMSERHLISNWHTIDLTTLGEVHAIGFKLTSSIDSDTDKYIPKYFCLDNLKIKS